MKTAIRIVFAYLLLVCSMVIIGAAQSPDDSGIRLAKDGAMARMSENGVNLTISIERPGNYPVRGLLEATLYDLKGKRIAHASRQVRLVRNPANVDITVEAALQPANPERYILKYEFHSAKGGFSEQSSLYTLVSMIETRVLGPSEVMAGSNASLRIVVRDANHDRFIEGALVSVKLGDKEVFKGKTDAMGTLNPEIPVPNEPGEAKLVVRVDSPLGVDSYERSIKVKLVERVLLVTDKPLYQPGQNMHLRALALRQPDLKPLSKMDLVFEVEDSKGNKVFKKTVKTDEFGIASAIFTLASEVNMGEYKVRAMLGETTSVEKTVTVDRYVLPKFKISFDSDRKFYMPGQKVRGNLDAIYFFGKPVSKGDVRITASKFDVGFQSFASIEGKTDAEGHYSFEINLPDYFVGEPLEQGKARVQLELSVTDGSGHEEIKTAWLTVAKDSIIIDAIPERGKLQTGVPNKIFVLLSQPGGQPMQGEVLDPFTKKWTSTDDLGIAVLTVTPEKEEISFTVEARDNSGSNVKRSFTVSAVAAGAGILVRPDHGIYRAGDSMRVMVLSPTDGTAYIDLIHEGQTMHTAWTEIRGGAGEITMQIPLDAQGSGVVHAYRLTKTGTWMRDTRRVFIEPATELSIDVRPGKETYLPAEDASIDFFVKDSKGNPVAAALGIQIVDESVFALQEMRPGLEKIYFLLEEELANPKYEVHGFSLPTVISEGPLPLEPAGPSPRADRLSQVLLAAAHTDVQYGITVNTADDRKGNFQNAMQEYMKARAEDVKEAGSRYYAKHRISDIRYEETINKFIAEGLLKENDILDPWGKMIRVTGYHPWPELVSAGPDGEFDTADDIYFAFHPPQPPNEPMPLMAVPRKANGHPRGGFAGEAEADFAAAGPVREAPKPRDGRDGDDGSSEGGSEEPRIRSYFPETLLVEPALITDGRGHAVLNLQMADSITTWRLTAMANSKGGALGSTTHGIKVFQEFFVDINLPVALTRNDRVTIPVAVFNYLPGSQTVRLEMEEGDWFKINDDRKKTLKLEKNEVKGVGFDITVKDVGNHTITVKAYGSTRSDAVRRTIEVIPDGQEMVANFNGRLEGTVIHEIAYPAGVVPGANKLFVKVYPGMLSQVVEGLDNIFRMPGGCFEQTSSTTYPNILVLDYMQKAGKITPELKMKAEGYINNGYQRLLTFEVKGGGFEWFGQAPAHIVLTAYGLMEFHDMSKVHAVDPAIITRTQNWLVSQQKANGSWEPTQHYLDQVAARFTSDVLRNTAYVAWALADSGYEGAGLDKALGYLKENSNNAKDLYTKALIVMSLASADPKDATAKALMQEIIDKGVSNKDTISFPAGGDTAVYSSGSSADVETTALVGLALLRMKTHQQVTQKIINFLIENKDPYGTWYSTQATVMSLKVLIGSLDMSTKGGDAEVSVMIDGKERGKFELKGEKAEILQLIDLSEYAVTGKHEIKLKITGEGNAFYSVVGRHYVPWESLGPAARAPLSITVSYDRTQLETNDMVTATAVAKNLTPAVAHMIILDLGIPPGFEVQTEDFENYVKAKTIQRYSMTGRQIIVYLEKIDPKGKIELKYKLKATMPIRAQTFASRVYEYYNPANEAFANPVNLEVRGQ